MAGSLSASRASSMRLNVFLAVAWLSRCARNLTLYSGLDVLSQHRYLPDFRGEATCFSTIVLHI